MTMGSGVNTVIAGPTKEFFVNMITRDIQLPDAIVELIDNSIDGIKRQKAEKYDNFFINVTFNKDSFQIEDNCGGIDLFTAKNYAFVFGKPQEARDKGERVETTGTFGIGMKRALFKMGQNFEVLSTAKNSSFRLSVDVPKWMKENDWNFQLAESNDAEDNDISTCGTKITVTELFSGIAGSFEYIPFVNEVITKVRRRANAELTNGLTININGTEINGAFLSIINSGIVYPYKVTFESNNIKVIVLAGISGETDPDKAGWYVYCNNREVLSADKTSITTWRDDNDTDGIKYHNDFAAFRGFVFFTSSYPELLPWNTSKTGVDTSSPIYKEAKPHMINAFKVISSELRKLASLEEETRNFVAERIRNNPVKEIHYYTAQQLTARTDISFVKYYEDLAAESAEAIPTTRITYYAVKDIVDKAKSKLGVTTNKEVGLKAFEYFIEMEEI